MRRRVLVARLDSMGDVLLAGPAVRAIAAQADVVMLCSSRGAEAAHMLPGVLEVLEWDAPWILDPAPQANAVHIATLVSMIAETRVSEAVILTSFHQSPLPLALLLRVVGGINTFGISEDFAGSLLDVRLRPGVDVDEDIPEPERALAIAAAAGFGRIDDGRLRVRTPPSPSALSDGSPYTVLHPGAAVPARRWPILGFVKTARMLQELGRRIVITGGEAERELAQEIRHSAPGAIDLTGSCTLPQLAGVIAGATSIVCGNTGPAHLAAAVGTPVVSLFSPVVPAVRWAPYKVPHRLLGDQDAPCRGTRARQCPVIGHPCLSRVRAEEVVRAVLDLEIQSATDAGLYSETGESQ